VFSKTEKPIEEETRENQKFTKDPDIFQPDVGNVTMTTTGGTLTHVPNSTFTKMVDGRQKHQLDNVEYDNLFLDFIPIYFVTYLMNLEYQRMMNQK